jgi:ribosomal protein S18 acetylase RimI-like enzyme
MRSASRPEVHASVRLWSGAQFVQRVDEAMQIYVEAMNYPHYTGTQRAVTARRHASHDGFACRAVLDEQDRLLGFGYGYTTKPGQWWHDLVKRSMSDEMAADWLGNAFELSEVHVLPEFHGCGFGYQLVTGLADDIEHRAMLLSTPDADTRAFRLYRGLGFVDLARHYLFPGDARPFAVLGARLPLQPVPG